MTLKQTLPAYLHVLPSRILEDAVLQYFNPNQPELTTGRILGTNPYKLTPYTLALDLKGDFLWPLQVAQGIVPKQGDCTNK